MLLSSGTKLGVYEIITLLGARGMGEVYLAGDIKLDRAVALRSTQDYQGSTGRRRSRTVLAALDHPSTSPLTDRSSW